MDTLQRVWQFVIGSFDYLLAHTQLGSVVVGTLSQDETIDACIAIDDALTRHFAVVGTTGVGKSTAVSLRRIASVTRTPDAPESQCS